MSIFNLICKKCGERPKPDIARSNENWTVYPSKCKCGGEFKILFESVGEKGGKQDE